ncbi:MAG: SDR family oxidoreductase [Chloroflexi bacterium]|nr:SDR family oxidoreductase [Chloroflexota bacterium]
MALYLVTGGAGFIGSHLVAALLERGQRVRVLDDLSTGQAARLAPFAGRIELVQASLLDERALADAVRGVDLIFHQAALPSVQRSVEDPFSNHMANATGTLRLLLAAREAGAPRVVYASSSSVYGDTPTLPKVETMPPQPLSPYAVSKLAGEHYCTVFARLFGVATVSLRYFNVFGPAQDPTSQYAAVIPRFVTAMLRGERPTIYGDGLQSRDFSYVANAVHANLLAAEADGLAGQAVNIATGRRYTLLDLVAALNRLLGTSIAPRHAPPRPGDVRHSLADTSAAAALLGYQPQVDFEEGLRRTVAWYRERVR